MDIRGVFPLTSHNWDVYSKLKDVGDYFEYFDEWGLHIISLKAGTGFRLLNIR